MLNYLCGWIASAVAFLALDMLWLSQMAPRYYRPAIGHLLEDRVNLGAAIAFYLLYVTGVIVLAVAPAIEKGSLGKAALMGALVGLMAYGTYDLTNQATLRDWPLRLTLVDLAWGTVLTSLAAGAGFLAMKAFSS
jgi:uncharacterized membrane protein